MTKIATAEERKQQDKTYDCITSKRRSCHSTGTTVSKSSGSGSTGTLVSTASTKNKSLVILEKEEQFKRLTNAELAEKKSKGMCFTCDQKFTPGHWCASRTLQVLLVNKHTFADVAKASVSSEEGFKSNRTMRLKGRLGGEEIVVLIDCGSSYNLISANLVEKLGITTTDTADPLRCALVNGETVGLTGICRGVIISFPELQVVEDYLPCKMDTKRYDVILGYKWLKTLGDVMVNWQLYTMTFVSETGKTTLKGDPELCLSSSVPEKSMVDNHQADTDFKVGDLVFLEPYPKRQQTVALRPDKKLAPNFYGPYRIIKRVGKVGYELEVPNAPKRPLFHVSQLKKAKITDSAYPSIPVVFTKGMEVMLTPEQVKGVRCGNLQNLATPEVLIEWKNYEATWESVSSIRKEFPEFQLEDKLAAWVGSICKTP